MSIQEATRQDFEEGLREDGIRKPVRAPLGGLIDRTEQQMTALINTSASDCAISLNTDADRDPAGTIRKVLSVLHLMNFRGIEKKSHRQAMLRAGRKALAEIGEIPQ
jgi:hypothetical protein